MKKISTERKIVQCNIISDMAKNRALPRETRAALRDAANALAGQIILEVGFKSQVKGVLYRTSVLVGWFTTTIRRLPSVSFIAGKSDGFVVKCQDGVYIHCNIEEKDHE